MNRIAAETGRTIASSLCGLNDTSCLYFPRNLPKLVCGLETPAVT